LTGQDRNTEPEGQRSWLRLFPDAGYVVSQILVVVVLLGIFFERGISTPLEHFGVGYTVSFIFLLALVPSLIVGAIAGMSRLLSGTVVALLVRVGATALVVAVGVWIYDLGVVSVFSFYDDPIALGEYLGILVGMEGSLAVCWVIASATTRLLERRRHVREQ
jgi:hypothetical protein